MADPKKGSPSGMNAYPQKREQTDLKGGKIYGKEENISGVQSGNTS